MKCRDCLYFNYKEKNKDDCFDTVVITSECRRYAPREICGTGTGYSDRKFAIVDKEDWCGEFKEKLLPEVNND